MTGKRPEETERQILMRDSIGPEVEKIIEKHHIKIDKIFELQCHWRHSICRYTQDHYMMQTISLMQKINATGSLPHACEITAHGRLFLLYCFLVVLVELQALYGDTDSVMAGSTPKYRQTIESGDCLGDLKDEFRVHYQRLKKIVLRMLEETGGMTEKEREMVSQMVVSLLIILLF